MKIALFGHGGMGSVVASLARAQGHEIGAVFTDQDEALDAKALAARLKGHDVAIDFSVGSAVLAHVTACVAAGVPLVEGTTGWQADEAAVRRAVEQSPQGAMIVGANFSIGVNLFYRLVARAGELFSGLASYDTFVEEAHHAKKRDAPSGTALEIKRLLAKALGHDVPVTSTRAGHMPGTHRVGFDSAADQITLVHTARSRDGFAAGALLAARWIVGKRGMYAFSDVLDQVLDVERQVAR